MLRRAQDHDPDAWRRLVDYYAPRVRMWVGQYRLQAADAADVVQEVFLAVASGLERFRRDRQGDTFRGWLRGITRHKLQDFFRQWHKLQEEAGCMEPELLASCLMGDGAQGTQVQVQGFPDDGPICPEYELLFRLQSECSELEWRIFVRLVGDQQGAAEVADEFHVTRNVVYLTKSRVLKKARALIG
jgi:RNA polymerase sigma-70 factor (ECF subfamily)